MGNRELECSDDREARYRQRSQTNQRRYRQRKKAAWIALEAEVAALYRANEKLQEELRTMALRVCSHATGVTHEYYTLFKHGLNGGPCKVQAGYLHSVMSPTLVFLGDTSVDGITKILEQLHLYTALFDAFQLHLDHMETVYDSDDEVVVKTLARLELRLSRLSIATIYPTLIGTNEELVQQLIGRTMELRIISHFTIGKGTGKVERLSTEASASLTAVELLQLENGVSALETSALRSNGELVVPWRSQ
ncbi:hypothetical protein ACHHYP_16584 [Achlya hypogyna]|uniref:BZIP domain-containing protein n=1 Tax=Achlya hypogyna TaxID=1202772 RepID=A0A1V9ZEJ9_ACHHY|nr:hypothetical protein ACHHYP_16584 [Achlya hypogyna]